jgi:hypothetical protein
LAQLKGALTDCAPDAHGARTRTGLCVDQATAALSMLTGNCMAIRDNGQLSLIIAVEVCVGGVIL